MNKDDVKPFHDLFESVMPIYRMEASKGTKLIWWNLLNKYSLELISQAFEEHVKVNNRSITPADILAMIEKISPDGRPGADEAWALIPRREADTVVITEEMATALRAAQPLLDEGDQIAARMAFKGAYVTAVDQAKRAQIPAKWFISMGWDIEGRLAPVSEALMLGRITTGQACAALPKHVVATMLQEEQRLALLGPEENVKRVEEIISKGEWL